MPDLSTNACIYGRARTNKGDLGTLIHLSFKYGDDAKNLQSMKRELTILLQ